MKIRKSLSLAILLPFVLISGADASATKTNSEMQILI